MALDRLAQLAVDIIINARRANAQLKQVRDNTKKTATGFKLLANTISRIALAASAFLIIRRAMRLLTDSIKVGITNFAELETQITNVAKISKERNLDKLTKVFFDITQNVRGSDFKQVSDTMTTAARAGVQLGDGLENLTIAALRLQQASLDITAKDAAEGLSALSINLDGNIDRVSNLASGVDALSDNFITTSGEILKTSARLSGFAKAVGLSAEQLTGLSAALLSTRTSPTVVRSSVAKILVALQSDSMKVASVLKFTREEFIKFQQTMEDNPIEAIKQFIRALIKLNPKEQTEGLKRLGLASSRVQAVLKILPGILGNIDKAQKISHDETERGTSLIEKQIQTFHNAANGLKDIQNSWKLFTASLFENQAIINTVIGLMERLSDAFAGDFDINQIDTSNLQTLSGIRKEQAKLTDEFNKAMERRNELIEQQQGIRNRLGLKPITATQNSLELAKLSGQIKQNLRLRKLLNDQFRQIQQAEDTAARKERGPGFFAKPFIEAKKVISDAKIRKGLEFNIEGVLLDLGTDKLAQSLAKLDEEAEKLRTEFFLLTKADKKRLDAALEAKRQATKDKFKRDADLRKSKALGGFTGDLSGQLNIGLKFAKAFETFKGDDKTVELLEKLFNREFLNNKRSKTRAPEFIGATELWKRAITDTKKDDTAIAKEHLDVAKRMVDLAVEDRTTALAIKNKLEEIAAKTGKGFEIGP